MQMVMCEVRVHLKYVARIKEREEARIKYTASTISTVCEQKKKSAWTEETSTEMARMQWYGVFLGPLSVKRDAS